MTAGARPVAEDEAAAAIRTLGSATIWFDLTTSIKLSDIPPVGITRVECRYAAALARRLPGRIGFCRLDPIIRRFRIVEERRARAVLDLDARITGPQRRHRHRGGPILAATRAAERWFRFSRRRLMWRLARAFAPLHRLYGDVPFRPGDLLMLGGETWGRHDLEDLGRLRERVGVSIVVFCHDLVPAKFPHFHDPETARSFAGFARFMLRDAALILCSSQSTRRDLQDHARVLGLAPPDARVIPLGHDLAPPSPRRPSALPDHVRPGRYVLYVSTIQVRKNHQLLYRLWRRFVEERGGDVPGLVLVGIVGWLVDDLVHLLRHDPLLARHVTILTGMSDGELAWLYRSCLFTVYPSLYEGWGLPISESLAHGKACIASANSAMPEAGQGLALHLDPLDFAAWHREIGSLFDHPDRLAAIEAAIAVRYHRVDWTEAGDRFLREVARFLAQRPPPATAAR